MNANSPICASEKLFWTAVLSVVPVAMDMKRLLTSLPPMTTPETSRICGK